MPPYRKKLLFNWESFEILEQDEVLVFNFRIDGNVFGVSIAKDSITPEVLAAATAGLRDVYKSKTG